MELIDKLKKCKTDHCDEVEDIVKTLGIKPGTSRLVDYNDVRLCIALGIKRGMSLREFADFVETWEDFVEKPE